VLKTDPVGVQGPRDSIRVRREQCGHQTGGFVAVERGAAQVPGLDVHRGYVVPVNDEYELHKVDVKALNFVH